MNSGALSMPYGCFEYVKFQCFNGLLCCTAFKYSGKLPIQRVHPKMYPLPSVAVSMEEVEDAFLVEVESVETTLDLDPDGAILNTPVSLMLIVWMLHH